MSGRLGAAVVRAALVSEWERGSGGASCAFRCSRSGRGYAKAPAAPLLTGLENPLPLAIAADGAPLVGDWTRGTIHRIARV